MFCPSVCIFVSLAVCLSACLYVYRSVCQCVCLFACLSICVSVCVCASTACSVLCILVCLPKRLSISSHTCMNTFTDILLYQARPSACLHFPLLSIPQSPWIFFSTSKYSFIFTYIIHLISWLYISLSIRVDSFIYVCMRMYMLCSRTIFISACTSLMPGTLKYILILYHKPVYDNKKIRISSSCSWCCPSVCTSRSTEKTYGENRRYEQQSPTKVKLFILCFHTIIL